jgi:TIR domain
MANMVDRPDVFISYASVERSLIRPVYDRMIERNWRVFWDTTDIPPQSRWEQVLLDQLEAARVIVTFWSTAAIASDWVRREAEFGLASSKLLQAKLNECDIPQRFSGHQIVQMYDWRGAAEHQGFRDLIAAAQQMIKPGPVAITLASPRDDEEVNEDHLALVHSSWRRADKDREFNGKPMYQIHVMLVGQPSALARVTSVIYRLDDAWPPDLRSPTIADRSQNFGFYELANGYSLVHAVVKIEGQARAVRADSGQVEA